MALETGTYISDLVATNPTSTDPKSEGDNHLRLIKSTVKATFPNVTGAVTKTHTQLNNTVDKTGDTMTGNLNFSGTGLRLTGDFSNATISNRLMFQSSTTNGNTIPAALPNGTSVTAGFAAVSSSSDPSNSSEALVAVVGGSDVRVSSSVRGSGTQLPLIFVIGAAEAIRIDTNRNVLVTGSGGLGYGTGSGGTVTQATSKSTAVTLNKPSGQITMNSALLAANSSVSFQLTNSTVAAADVVSVGVTGGSNPDAYLLRARTFAGGVVITVVNQTGTGLSDAIQLQFNVNKGAAS